MKTPESIDAYLAEVPEPAHSTLQSLRRTLHALVPDDTETISYGLPTFRNATGAIVAFGAAKQHCALYPMSGATLASFKDELVGYSLSKGTLRFPLDTPLPEDLLRRIVEARLDENEEKLAVKAAAKAAGRKDAE